MYNRLLRTMGLFAFVTFSAQVAAEACPGYGPQTPRDIDQLSGENQRLFALAPPSEALNLCNIHMHRNAEHKAADFSLFAGADEHGGYQCNATASLTPAQLKQPAENHCGGINPGDTVEVHWVHTSCDVTPGKGLGSCLSPACVNPDLRVETQVFLVVNDASAMDFNDFAYQGTQRNGYHQPRALPVTTGKSVEFAGSTTGPAYTGQVCSPLQVTWSVRPQCATVDITSLSKWCKHNVFEEHHGHGVRQLVVNPKLLSPIR